MLANKLGTPNLSDSKNYFSQCLKIPKQFCFFQQRLFYKSNRQYYEIFFGLFTGSIMGSSDMRIRKAMREMCVNEKGIIVSVNAKGELGRRIRDMGIIPGSEFIITGKAPLYDPVALKMKGFTIILRNSEADFITCEVEA